MKRLNLTHKGPKLSAKAIQAIEKAIGINLPEEYVDFLHNHNGGSATGYVCHHKKHGILYINTFLSATDSRSGPISISTVMQNYDGLLPSDCVPIAFVSSDDVLLLRVRGSRAGQIDLKLAAEMQDDDPESGIITIAKSFSRFIEQLSFKQESELDENDYGLW